MYVVGTKPLKVKNNGPLLKPGEAIPEAETWKAHIRKAHLRTKAIIEIKTELPKDIKRACKSAAKKVYAKVAKKKSKKKAKQKNKKTSKKASKNKAPEVTP